MIVLVVDPVKPRLARGDLRPLTLETVRLRTTLPAILWSAADTDPAQPLPLLVVHDGPEYAQYSALVQLLDLLRVVPCRGPDEDERCCERGDDGRTAGHDLKVRQGVGRPCPAAPVPG